MSAGQQGNLRTLALESRALRSGNRTSMLCANICLVVGVVVVSSVIMGIDPGLANTGWGVIKCTGARVEPLAYGCISTTNRYDLPTRLAIIHDNLCEIIDRYMPGSLSVEGIYFGENAKSAIPTAQARGAALVACAYKGLEYGEYTPMQIKQAVVGTGAADKEQVQYMVKAILKLDHEPKPDHAADALAAAITHARLRTAREIEKQSAARLPGRMDDKASAAEAKSKFEARVKAALDKERSMKKRRA